MSIVLPFRAARYMTAALTAGGWPPTGLPSADRVCGSCRWPVCPARRPLLRVVLDDELLLDQGVDLSADRERVHQDAHLVWYHLDPGRRRALARLRPGHH